MLFALNSSPFFRLLCRVQYWTHIFGDCLKEWERVRDKCVWLNRVKTLFFKNIYYCCFATTFIIVSRHVEFDKIQNTRQKRHFKSIFSVNCSDCSESNFIKQILVLIVWFIRESMLGSQLLFSEQKCFFFRINFNYLKEWQKHEKCATIHFTRRTFKP